MAKDMEIAVAAGIKRVRAIVADDERLLRDQLVAALREVWPELELVAQARNGQEAVELVAQFKPDVVFLDIRMPGLTAVSYTHLTLPTKRIV